MLHFLIMDRLRGHKSLFVYVK